MVMVTQEWRSGQPAPLAHVPPETHVSARTHLHQHRFRQLLPVHDLDGDLLARDAVDAKLNQPCGAELKMWVLPWPVWLSG